MDELEEMIQELDEEYGTDFFERQDLDRVVEEVLGDVEVWTESQEGPDGPWYYKTLTVTRKMNSIFVRDVDGRMAARLDIPSRERYAEGVNPADVDLNEKLKAKLEELNEETLAAL